MVTGGWGQPASSLGLLLRRFGEQTLLTMFLLANFQPSVAEAFPAELPPKAKYSRAASDTKTAVTQAIVYAKDKGVYPRSLRVLRESGYANTLEDDPWGNAYVLSSVLTRGGKPQHDDDVYVYSKGPKGSGAYLSPFTPDTGSDGSVGYSSRHGSWTGRPSRGVGATLLWLAAPLALLGVVVYAGARFMRRAPGRRQGSVSRRETAKRPWYSVSVGSLVRFFLWVLLLLFMLSLLSPL
jgi:hypothetical protein